MHLPMKEKRDVVVTAIKIAYTDSRIIDSTYPIKIHLCENGAEDLRSLLDMLEFAYFGQHFAV